MRSVFKLNWYKINTIMNAEKSASSTIASIQSPSRSGEAAGDILLRRLIEFAPLLLAFALALWTFWLVNSVHDKTEQKPAAPVTQPDYYLHDFELRRYNTQGKLHSQIAGAYGEHIPNPDTLHVTKIIAFTQSETGSHTHGTARRGTSQEKDKIIELFGDVYITHQPEPKPNQPKPEVVIFQSEYLKATDGMQYFSTDKPVHITQGQHVMRAQGMQFANDKKIVSAQGRVKATIAPADK